MLWLVLLFLILINSAKEAIQISDSFHLTSLILNLSFLPISLWFCWFFGWRFKNEVYDLESGLLVKDKGKSIKIADEMIKKIIVLPFVFPSIATVYLKTPNELGKKFAFATTKNTGFLMNKNPAIEQLMQRINLRK